jgi:arginase
MAEHKNRVKIIENKSEIGAGTRGSGLGIDSLKIASLNMNSSYFSRLDSIVLQDFNHLLFEEVKYPRAIRIEGVIEVFKLVADQVSNQLLKNNFPIILSGDHSGAGGTIAGIKMAYPGKRLGVIWIDAHADLHSPYTSPTGNIHGMTLATALNSDNADYRIQEIDSATNELWTKLKEVGNIYPKINARDLVYVALRDTEEPEDFYISNNEIKSVDVETLRRNGAEFVANDVLEYLKSCDLIYISFDVDSMDCDLVSYGTGTPVQNGLTEQETSSLINHLLIDKRTNCLEIVEINPCLDNKQNKMAETSFRILESATSIIEKRG